MELRKEYVIEYIDNERDLDLLNSGTHPAPWELYKTKVFKEEKPHSAYTGETGIDGEAWRTFVLWKIAGDQIALLDGDRVRHPLYCQMWQNFYDENGNLVYEDFCELPSTAAYSIRVAINRSREESWRKLMDSYETIKKELDSYEAFLKNYKADGLYHKFREEELKNESND